MGAIKGKTGWVLISLERRSSTFWGNHPYPHDIETGEVNLYFASVELLRDEYQHPPRSLKLVEKTAPKQREPSRRL